MRQLAADRESRFLVQRLLLRLTFLHKHIPEIGLTISKDMLPPAPQDDRMTALGEDESVTKFPSKPALRPMTTAANGGCVTGNCQSTDLATTRALM